MATVSERALDLQEVIENISSRSWDSTIGGVIEQALLAERRLAMEEAARAIETSPVYCQSLAQMLRAAAEKEVGK